jgi:hypothetical protein
MTKEATKSPNLLAQAELETKLAMLRALHEPGSHDFTVAAQQEYGNNSLRLLLGNFGPYETGWPDTVKVEPWMRDRLSMFTWKELVATSALAQMALKEATLANRRLRIIQWLLAGVLLVCILNIGK